MENATKALLIAASVLIVIILIAVSIKILGSTRNVPESVNTVSSDIGASMFNSQFENYFGLNVSGSQVKTLLSKITTNNNTNAEHKVFVNFYPLDHSDISAHHLNDNNKNIQLLQTITLRINNNSSYSVKVNSTCDTYAQGYNNGYIACIDIKESN